MLWVIDVFVFDYCIFYFSIHDILKRMILDIGNVYKNTTRWKSVVLKLCVVIADNYCVLWGM